MRFLENTPWKWNLKTESLQTVKLGLKPINRTGRFNIYRSLPFGFLTSKGGEKKKKNRFGLSWLGLLVNWVRCDYGRQFNRKKGERYLIQLLVDYFLTGDQWRNTKPKPTIPKSCVFAVSDSELSKWHNYPHVYLGPALLFFLI